MTSVQDSEIGAVLDIFTTYGRPLGASGVLLATAVVTSENERRVRLVLGEMEQRGLIRVKHAARDAEHEAIYELV